jgi:hypothetical protein
MIAPVGIRGGPEFFPLQIGHRRDVKMSSWSVVRWTGVLGLAAIIVQLVAFIVSFAGGVPPAIDDANKLLAYAKNAHFAIATALILFFIGLSLFIGFIAGLRAVAVAAAADHEWLATATFGAGLAITVMGFVSLGLLLADLAIAVSSHADAAIVRALAETSGVVGGPPALVPTAVFLGAAGWLGATTKILPRWLALVGWIGAVLVLIAAFSAYAGSDPAAFWSPNGIINALAGLPLVVWTLGASVVFLRQKEGVARRSP